MITTTTVTVNNYRLRVLESGEGIPVLLLHGFGVNADDWRPTMELLQHQGYHAIAIDALGFGASDKPDGPVYSLQLYADLTAGVLDTLGVERAVVVGHSMGGKLAISLTLNYPERVTRLLLADSEGFMQIPMMMRKGGSIPFLGKLMFAFSSNPTLIRMQLAAAFYNPDQFVTPELVARGLTVMADPGIQRAMLNLSRYYEANDLESTGLRARLREITCPTLIVWGEHDRMFAASCGEAARREIPGAHLVVIPRCGHFPQLEAFRAFHGLLMGFLAREA